MQKGSRESQDEVAPKGRSQKNGDLAVILYSATFHPKELPTSLEAH